MMTLTRPFIFATMLLMIGFWLLFLRPSFLGGPASYVIVYGVSMEPTMYTGDLALAVKRNTYAVGDVVAFRVEGGETRGYRVPEGGGIVIHRIIGGNAVDGFILQGDNNSFVDPWAPTAEEIIGKAVFFIPRLGAVFSYLQDPLRLSLAVGAIFLYTSLAGAVLSWKALNARERRRRRRERAAQSRRVGRLASWLSN